MPQTPPFTGQLNTGGYNKNLYQTKEEGYPGLFYHDNNLVSGSLEALIRHLVPTVDYYPDVSVYILLFLLLSLVASFPLQFHQRKEVKPSFFLFSLRSADVLLSAKVTFLCGLSLSFFLATPFPLVHQGFKVSTPTTHSYLLFMFCNVYGIVPLCEFCFGVVLKLIFKHKSCVVSFLFSLQRTYIFTFLLSSRLFIHPYELMSKVCHLCMEQQRLGDPQADKVCTTKNVVVNVLGLVVIIVYSVLTCLSHINR